MGARNLRAESHGERGMTTRPARFAAAVHRRHGSTSRFMAPAERVARRVAQLLHLTTRAAVHLHLAARPSPSRRMNRDAIRWRLATLRDTLLERRTLRESLRLTERVVVRTSRLDTIAHPNATASVVPPTAAPALLPARRESVLAATTPMDRTIPIVRPVPRVVLSRVTGEAARETASDRAWRPAASTRMSPAPAELPPAEIERLTAQVIDNLDRRILAHRERRGRI